MSGLCPQCGEEYRRLAMHWNRSDCQYPSFSRERMRLLSGVLMGDGDLHGRDDPNPHFRVRLTNERFLRHLDAKLGVLSDGVFLSAHRRRAGPNGERIGRPASRGSRRSTKTRTTTCTDFGRVHTPGRVNFVDSTTVGRNVFQRVRNSHRYKPKRGSFVTSGWRGNPTPETGS
jgi:hypothetical protein